MRYFMRVWFDSAGITLSDVFLQRGYSGIDGSGNKIANGDLILKHMRKAPVRSAKVIAYLRAANDTQPISSRVA